MIELVASPLVKTDVRQANLREVIAPLYLLRYWVKSGNKRYPLQANQHGRLRMVTGAILYVRKLHNRSVRWSTNTFSQKRYQYEFYGDTFFFTWLRECCHSCYQLYQENPDSGLRHFVCVSPVCSMSEFLFEASHTLLCELVSSLTRMG